LKRESDNLNVNPFRLTTQYEEFRNILPSTINYQETGKDEINSQSKQSNEIKASKKETKEENVKLPSSFADRYSDEIASTSKIKQYQLFGSKFKTELLKEAKELQHQHKQELQEAEKIERIVTNVSDMITEFVYLLQSQTDSVDNIHDAAVYATEYVKDADVELQKTIDRSKSHSRNMVVLIIVLSFLLLILDYFTP
jgi:t-SNARE complex subunit (syntaxin)